MNFHPFNLADEVTLYFEFWQEENLDEETELTKRQINKIVKVIENHPRAEEIYRDLELWFSNESERPDVMSDLLMDICEQEFESMFDVEHDC